MQPKLIVVFCLSLFCAIAGPIILPGMRLCAFAPFLTILFTRTSLINALWCAFGCGMIIDLLSSNVQLGTHALSYILVTLLLFRVRRHFFAHKPIALAILSSAFSLLSTLFLLIACKNMPITFKSLLSDLIIMPGIDGIYAFLGYTCPIIIYRHLRKILKQLTLEQG
ncbi:MAG: rod shape-determining protein MreD [Chlamydiales bacterium]|nr:rod shape-determining protein MreD [Chlamydiales bacterium]